MKKIPQETLSIWKQAIGKTIDIVIMLMQARKKLGLSQEQLADKIGVSKSTIKRIESGSVIPRMDIIVGMADVLGVKIFC